MSDVVAWDGPHQAGIITPPQRFLQLAAFDLTVADRGALIEVLRTWQLGIEALAAGLLITGTEPLSGPMSPFSCQASPPADSGEAVGLPAARLTVTVGFGGSLFDHRFGLAARKPPALAELPVFTTDRLDPALSDGDLALQACADNQLVAEHAVRNLARHVQGLASLRWSQSGFCEPAANQTPRNLLGFKEGTSNLRTPSQFRRNVWAAPSDGAPWMKGGTYMVYRRVRLDRRLWDDHALGRQEHAIGRHKVSGAPFGGTSEFDPVDPELLPPRCHVRLANPRLGAATKQELVLRRSYSYLDGYRAELAAVDAGLAFICFQRFPARQFVPIQRRLADADPLNAYLTHTASGQFAIPPGVPAGGGFPGQDLFRP